MNLLVVLLILLILLGGGGVAFHHGLNWTGGGIGLGTILAIILIIFLLSNRRL